MWLVNAVQGYGEVRDDLNAADREKIDAQVFRRAAHFLSVDSQATFDRIHNHATWATAGVGMTGYLLGDRDLVDRALLGSDKSGSSGFLRQTEELFSPSGYYAEGPYYQRYACCRSWCSPMRSSATIRIAAYSSAAMEFC